MTRTEQRDSPTLIEQLRQRYRTDETEVLFSGQEAGSVVKLPDGYVRLTPVQPYREGPGWRRKRILTIVLICAVAAALAAVGILIWRHGLHLPAFKLK